MPDYDQDTISEFAVAKGHQIWPFRANTDDPKGDLAHWYETEDFLRDRICAYCQDVITKLNLKSTAEWIRYAVKDRIAGQPCCKTNAD